MLNTNLQLNNPNTPTEQRRNTLFLGGLLKSVSNFHLILTHFDDNQRGFFISLVKQHLSERPRTVALQSGKCVFLRLLHIKSTQISLPNNGRRNAKKNTKTVCFGVCIVTFNSFQ